MALNHKYVCFFIQHFLLWLSNNKMFKQGSKLLRKHTETYWTTNPFYQICIFIPFHFVAVSWNKITSSRINHLVHIYESKIEKYLDVIFHTTHSAFHITREKLIYCLNKSAFVGRITFPLKEQVHSLGAYLLI